MKTHVRFLYSVIGEDRMRLLAKPLLEHGFLKRRMGTSYTAGRMLLETIGSPMVTPPPFIPPPPPPYQS